MGEGGLIAIDEGAVLDSLDILNFLLVAEEGGVVFVGEDKVVGTLEPVPDVGVKEGEDIFDAGYYSFRHH